MVRLIRNKNEVVYECDNIEVVAMIHDCLSVTVPSAHFSPAYKAGSWDGRKGFYNARQRSFGSGLLPKVIRKLEKEEVEFELVLQEARFSIMPKHLSTDLRPHQRRSVLKFFRYDFGILKMPTRGGKTITAAEILRLILERDDKHPVVFVVDTIDLYDQTIDEFSKFLCVPRDHVGVLEGDRPFEPKLINVWKVQTLVSLLSPRKGKLYKAKVAKKNLVSKWMRTVQALVVDEWQEYGSDKRQRALKLFANLKHFLAISATPYKATDPLSKMTLMATGGGIFHTVEEEGLVKKNFLTQTSVALLTNDLTGPIENENYREFFTRQIINNGYRNKKLADLLALLEKLGLKTLAMFSSRIHGNAISELTGYTFLSGSDNKDVRLEAKTAFLAKKGGVLLASDIWKKGITLPQVQVLLNCNGAKEDSLIIQRMGRIKGAIEGKDRSFVIDIIDMDDSWLSSHSYRRVRVYEKNTPGGNLSVIDSSDEDYLLQLYRLLKDWFDAHPLK
jgi:superfamily II DNA or RNA helicase